MNRSLSVGLGLLNAPGSCGGLATATHRVLNRLVRAGSHVVVLVMATARLPLVVVPGINITPTHIHIPTVQALCSAQATRFIHICIKFSNNKRK